MKKTKMLKKNYEYKNVLSKGKYYSGKYIEIFIKPNNYCENRLGLAISTKTGKAYIRNRIKRLIREAYKNIEEDILKGYDIVFLWKKHKDSSEANYYNIKNDMLFIFGKIK